MYQMHFRAFSLQKGLRSLWRDPGCPCHPLCAVTHAAGGKASYFPYDPFPRFHPEQIDMR